MRSRDVAAPEPYHSKRGATPVRSRMGIAGVIPFPVSILGYPYVEYRGKARPRIEPPDGAGGVITNAQSKSE